MLMNELKSMMNIELNNSKGKIAWTAIGNSILEKIYSSSSSGLYNNFIIFNGLDNLYPVNWDNCVEEFITKPYDNYKTIVRDYQPLVVLVNSVYKALKNKTPDEILKGTLPLNYFINKSFQNAGIEKDFNIQISSCDWCRTDGNNFGDMITPYIYRKIKGTQQVPRAIGNNILLGAGSILNFLSTKNSIVWGSGLGMKELIDKVVEPRNILSVRGELTYKELNKKGIKCPKIFGDPGLMLQHFYNPSIIKTYKVGIIPHWVEYSTIKKLINVSDNIIVINLQDPFEKIIDSILACDYTMSTSLHGIVVSHAYKIKCAWLRLPHPKCKIGGGYFKFLDYYSSLEIYNNKPVIIKDGYFNQIDSIIKDIEKYPQPGNFILNKLIYNTIYLCPISNLSDSSRKWINESLMDKKEQKFIIYTDWIETYLTMEPFTFIKNLEKYGWSLIKLSQMNIDKLKTMKSTVLCVTYDDFDISQLKCENIKLIYKIDDLFPYKKIRETCIETADIIISPYQYLFTTDKIVEIYPSIVFTHSYHIPYSAVEEFYIPIEFNKEPIEKIFVSGSQSDVYPLRCHVRTLSKYIVSLEHPSYINYKHTIVNEKFYEELSKYLCCFTDALCYKYVLLKVFEICSVGSLLLVDSLIKIQLEKLGFIDTVNCIMCTKENMEVKMEWVLDKNNRHMVDEMRLDGMTLVREKHGTIKRSSLFEDIVNNKNKQIFEKIYDGKIWNNGDCNVPLSGTGSSFENTKDCSRILEDFIYSNKCTSVLDLGCGDLTWISKTKFFNDTNVKYTGVDVVDNLIKIHTNKYPNNDFLCTDIVQFQNFKKVSMIIIRDVIFHLTNREILQIFKNIENTFDFIAITSCVNAVNTDKFNKWRFSEKNIHETPFNKLKNHSINLFEPNFNRFFYIYSHANFMK